MSNYKVNQASRTTSNCVLAGILAGQLLAMSGNSAPLESNQEALLVLPYRVNSTLSSFDQIRSMFGSFQNQGPDRFVESISSFYTKLAASQEPLGTEFARVLNENLWDLYER